MTHRHTHTQIVNTNIALKKMIFLKSLTGLKEVNYSLHYEPLYSAQQIN